MVAAAAAALAFCGPAQGGGGGGGVRLVPTFCLHGNSQEDTLEGQVLLLGFSPRC